MILLFLSTFFTVLNTLADAAPSDPKYFINTSKNQERKTNLDYPIPSSFSSSSSTYKVNNQPSFSKSNDYNQHLNDALEIMKRHAMQSTPKSMYSSDDKQKYKKRPYKCHEESCTVTCKTQVRLEEHKNKCHSGDNVGYKCNKCSKIFQLCWHLDRHRGDC